MNTEFENRKPLTVESLRRLSAILKMNCISVEEHTRQVNRVLREMVAGKKKK
jgi:hypothetical protein